MRDATHIPNTPPTLPGPAVTFQFIVTLRHSHIVVSLDSPTRTYFSCSQNLISFLLHRLHSLSIPRFLFYAVKEWKKHCIRSSIRISYIQNFAQEFTAAPSAHRTQFHRHLQFKIHKCQKYSWFSRAIFMFILCILPIRQSTCVARVDFDAKNTNGRTKKSCYFSLLICIWTT